MTLVGALAAFTATEADVLLQTSMIASVLAGTCFASVVMWAAFGVAISHLLGSARARVAFNRSMAGLLVASPLTRIFLVIAEWIGLWRCRDTT